MEEKNFEKKNSKKIVKVLIPVILLACILLGVFAYCTLKATPENVFKTAVEKIFNSIEVQEDNKSAKASMQITANLNSEDSNIAEIQKYLEKAKIIINEEADIQKEIIKYNLIANYENEDIIDADMIIQNEKIYLFAEEFFSKYIEILPEDLNMQDFNTILEKSFKTANKVSQKETKKLINEIKKVILEYLKEQEYLSNKEEILVKNETIKTTKSTLILDEEDLSELLIKILNVLKNNNYFIEITANTEVDIKEEIENLITDLEEVEETNEFNLEISLYTKGIMKEIVKAEAIVKENSKEELLVDYVKEDSNKSTITLKVDEEIIKLKVEKNNKNRKYTLELPEELKDIKISLEHKKENKNKGILILNLSIPEEIAMALDITGALEAKLTIEYEIDYKAKITEENVSESVTINEFTQENEEEILKNFENSKLYELITSI